VLSLVVKRGEEKHKGHDAKLYKGVGAFNRLTLRKGDDDVDDMTAGSGQQREGAGFPHNQAVAFVPLAHERDEQEDIQRDERHQKEKKQGQYNRVDVTHGSLLWAKGWQTDVSKPFDTFSIAEGGRYVKSF